MDIGIVVSWIQAAIWLLAVALWIGRILRGEVSLRPWVKRVLSSNGLIGIVVVSGLIMSGISLYFSYTANAIPKELTVNISSYEPQYPAPMRVISDKTFEDQDVPLDGFIYQRCTFVNVCFIFEGGAYGLQDSTVKNHWKVCVKDKRIENYSDLMRTLKMFSPKIEHIQKTIVNR